MELATGIRELKMEIKEVVRLTKDCLNNQNQKRSGSPF